MTACRSGITLIEMTLLLSVTSTVLGLSGMVIHRAYQIQASSMEAVIAQQSLLALADYFREDIASSQLASIDSDRLTLNTNGHSISYRIDSDPRWERSVIVREVEQNGSTRMTNRFRLRYPLDVTFARDDSGRQPLVSMTLARQIHSSPSILATIESRLAKPDSSSQVQP